MSDINSRDLNSVEIREELFLESLKVGKELHEDINKAKKLFEQLKDVTRFEAIIEKRRKESDDFLSEAKAFARIIKTWREEYIRYLLAVKKLLSVIVNQLNESKEFDITFNNRKVRVLFKKEVYYWKVNHEISESHGRLEARLKAHPRTLQLIEKEEYKVAEEIAEFLTINFRFKEYLEYVKELNKKYDILQLASEVENSAPENIAEVVEKLHDLTLWWFELTEIMGSMKKYVHKAVKADKEVYEKLKKFITKEERAELKNKQLKMVELTAGVLAKIGLNIIPGGGLIDASITIGQDGRKIRRLWREIRKDTSYSKIEDDKKIKKLPNESKRWTA